MAAGDFESGVNSVEDNTKSATDESEPQTVWIPECDTSSKPKVGQGFFDLESAFTFYSEYGRKCGFDVRRSSHKKDTDGTISFKYFLCSKSGFKQDSTTTSRNKVNSNSSSSNSSLSAPEKDSSFSSKKRRRISRKCGCAAMMSLKSIGENGFVVHSFNEAHNHMFAEMTSRQFLRCNRKLTDVHRKFIIDVSKNCIGSSRAHNIFKSMAGSFENIGATKTDFKNFSRDIKKYIGIHDADMILQKFKDKSEISENGFRYEFEVDSDNRLTRLFWADAKGRSLFSVYGDCVSFDATYRTNKYKMIFVPFVGIDNHWKSITFAAGLLIHEDVENFEWLCKAFERVMGAQPKCVITDQCPAMNIAIPKCFPLSKHRYCMWHIMKKFPSKLGTLFCVESPFMDQISSFIWMDHATPEEFEAGWNRVIVEFKLQKHPWLTEMYELRHKWIPAFFNDDPMVGLLRTTSRSESSNFYFSHFVERGDTLSEFYMCYESAIEKQRHENYKLNHDDTGTPAMVTTKQIEKDAARYYTLTIFYKVQDQIRRGFFELQTESMSTVDCQRTFLLKDEIVKGKLFEVQVNIKTPDVKCSCGHYTRLGLLCKHSLFALSMSGIYIIPRHLLKDRWMKNAEKRFSTLQFEEVVDSCHKEKILHQKKTDCWFDFQACMTDAGNDAQLVDIISESLMIAKEKISDTRSKSSVRITDDVIQQLVGSRPSQNISVLPPKECNTKGSRKRIPNPAEKTIGGIKRQKRLCHGCNTITFHDSRNCEVGKKLKAQKEVQARFNVPNTAHP